MELQQLMIPFSMPELGVIQPDSRLFFSGSCFGASMYAAASKAGFQSFYGPCGIVFNPLAMAKGFRRAMDERPYEADDLIFDGELYHSFNHHSSFSGTDAARVLEGLNDANTAARAALIAADVLLVSFGTAWYYTLKHNGNIVANNHKQPAAKFNRTMATSSEIVSHWKQCIDVFRVHNPGLKVCLAVSPVKYLKDGLVEHNRSKASLITAVHELCTLIPDTYYFPSYEILVDVLRDYRWYAEDMAHPSPQATGIIWHEFLKTWMTEAALTFEQKTREYRKLCSHKVRFPETDTAHQHALRLATLKAQMVNTYPHLLHANAWLEPD
ncbi:MAG: hypothetical protein RL160_753 [Bacteroidota bacterium]